MNPTGSLLLKPGDFEPFSGLTEIAGVFNPGAVRLPSKKILLLARVAENAKGKGAVKCPFVARGKRFKVALQGIRKRDIARIDGNLVFLRSGQCRLTTFSYFKRVVLDREGLGVERIAKKPSFAGTHEEGQFGVEDPRITRIGNRYAMTYVAVSPKEGVSTMLALSKDALRWQRQGIIFREQNKDVVLFPEKINGKFVALHRPEACFRFSKPSIWISYSKDLAYWGREHSIMQTREKAWDSERIGAGAVPVRTKEGWLEIYHGVEKRKGRNVYSAGAVLLDLRKPAKVLARSPRKRPLFAPKAGFERKGFVNNVVFPTAAIPDLNGKDLLVYYGAADTSIAVKRLALKDVLNSLKWV